MGMETVFGVLVYAAAPAAVIALIVAFAAYQKASSQAKSVADARDELRRRAEGAREETNQELALLRRMLADSVSGKPMSAEMILEGRLWRDVATIEALKLVQDGSVRILDVRTPRETALGIIAGAQLIPVDELERRAGEVQKDGQPILVYCAGGSRSAAACDFLTRAGVAEVLNLRDGFQSWSGPRANPG